MATPLDVGIRTLQASRSSFRPWQSKSWSSQEHGFRGGTNTMATALDALGGYLDAQRLSWCVAGHAIHPVPSSKCQPVDASLPAPARGFGSRDGSPGVVHFGNHASKTGGVTAVGQASCKPVHASRSCRCQQNRASLLSCKRSGQAGQAPVRGFR